MMVYLKASINSFQIICSTTYIAVEFRLFDQVLPRKTIAIDFKNKIRLEGIYITKIISFELDILNLFIAAMCPYRKNQMGDDFWGMSS